MTQPQTQVDKALCTLCGLCVEACPCGSVRLEEDELTFTCMETCSLACLEVIGGWCLCEEVCPTGAITCAFEIVIEADQDTKEK